MMRSGAVLAVVLCGAMACAQNIALRNDPLAPFVKVKGDTIVLEHVRVIDGTGAPAKEDQRIVIQHGRIANVLGGVGNQLFPANTQHIDLTGKTVFPGLVGMHEHLFYPLPDGGPGLLPLYGEMADSAPRLYLAGGVTAARTAGSLEPYTDISVKQAIDEGKIPGPEALPHRALS